MLHNPKWDEGLLDLTKPSLKALAHILRHKELWPDGFRWYFGSCHSCAMGIAKILWDFKSTYPEHVAQGFGISHTDTRNIFCFDNPKMPKDEYGYARPSEVSPEMVADWIDAYLTNKE